MVNQVGVNINTASPALLSHVAGLNKTISENIVKYREEEGLITSRAQIKKVPRLGAKAFEQAAGFLRIPESENFLDRTGVHPESYPAVKKLFTLLGIKEMDEEAQAKLILSQIFSNQVAIYVILLMLLSFARMSLI